MLDHAAEPQLLPLASLTHDSLNPRHEIDPEGTAALAASIRAIGLIQPLAGRRIGRKKIGITVGGRRLAALKSMGADAPASVPVVIAPDDATAEAWATADPVTHRQLHPADEIRAYGRMARSTPAPQIAAAFGVTEAHVRRRLALASLPEAAIDALKSGRITLSAAAILTTAQSEERVLDLLAATPADRCPGDHWWHSQLHPKSVTGSDRRARFVGVDRYVAAGGAATEDLFSDSAILHDVPLLDRLFADKLTATAEQIREAEDWAWVTAHPSSALWDISERGLSRVPLSKDRSGLGIAIYVDQFGELCRSDQAWRRGAAPKSATASDEVEVNNPNTARDLAVSQALRDEIQRIHHTALRTALLAEPELAIDLLGWSLSGQLSSWSQPVAISLNEQSLPADEMGCTVDPRLKGRAGGGDERQSAETFTVWLRRNAADRIAALAIAACRGLNTLTAEVRNQLVEVLNVSPRSIWTPTAVNFFGRLRAPALDAIWADLFAGHSAEADTGWVKLKTKEKAAELGKLFGDPEYRSAWGMGEQLAARVDAWMPEVT